MHPTASLLKTAMPYPHDKYSSLHSSFSKKETRNTFCLSLPVLLSHSTAHQHTRHKHIFYNRNISAQMKLTFQLLSRGQESLLEQKSPLTFSRGYPAPDQQWKLCSSDCSHSIWGDSARVCHEVTPEGAQWVLSQDQANQWPQQAQPQLLFRTEEHHPTPNTSTTLKILKSFSWACPSTACSSSTLLLLNPLVPHVLL